MPSVLIAGCGYLGGATASAFNDIGWDVEGWSSSGENVSSAFVVRAVDLTTAASVQRAGGSFDAVIHCASSRGGTAEDYRRIYLNGARNLAAAFPQSVLVFTSSTSVYAQCDGKWVDEASPAQPARETAQILRQTEEFVLGKGGIVARLAGIHGPGRSALLRKFLTGTAAIDPVPRYLNHIHRHDAASALLLLARRRVDQKNAESGGASSVYNVSDDHPILQREAYGWLAAHCQRSLPPLSETSARRKRGNTNKRVSSKKLQDAGWAPKFPTFESAMRESILPEWSEQNA